MLTPNDRWPRGQWPTHHAPDDPFDSFFGARPESIRLAADYTYGQCVNALRISTGIRKFRPPARPTELQVIRQAEDGGREFINEDARQIIENMDEAGDRSPFELARVHFERPLVGYTESGSAWAALMADIRNCEGESIYISQGKKWGIRWCALNADVRTAVIFDPETKGFYFEPLWTPESFREECLKLLRRSFLNKCLDPEGAEGSAIFYQLAHKVITSIPAHIKQEEPIDESGLRVELLRENPDTGKAVTFEFECSAGPIKRSGLIQLDSERSLQVRIKETQAPSRRVEKDS